MDSTNDANTPNPAKPRWHTPTLGKVVPPFISMICVILLFAHVRRPDHDDEPWQSQVRALIKRGRYAEAVRVVESVDISTSLTHQGVGSSWIGIMGDGVYVPGVDADRKLHGRVWCMPGASDTPESRTWQRCATLFAFRYNTMLDEKISSLR